MGSDDLNLTSIDTKLGAPVKPIFGECARPKTHPRIEGLREIDELTA